MPCTQQGDCSGRVAKETGETTAVGTGARKVLQWRHVRSPGGGLLVGGGKGCQPPRGQVGMGLPRGDERVRGGRAFKGGGAPRLGLGPEAALKVMAHSGPRAGGGHRRGLWVKGAGGGVGLSP